MAVMRPTILVPSFREISSAAAGRANARQKVIVNARLRINIPQLTEPGTEKVRFAKRRKRSCPLSHLACNSERDPICGLWAGSTNARERKQSFAYIGS